MSFSRMTSHQPIMTWAMLDFLDREFLQLHFGGRTDSVDAVGPMTAQRHDHHYGTRAAPSRVHP